MLTNATKKPAPTLVLSTTTPTSFHNRDRQLEILKLLGSGKSHQEIAAVLHLTKRTVKNHLTNIFCQLGVPDFTQAALWAYRNLPSF
ncbi:MAG: hypothetical protein KME49_21220 [Brasilonema octagenarum HA4186-MV1]|nr:hypothetical protein [Brasilonema octagenarum HA4186-MV1]